MTRCARRQEEEARSLLLPTEWQSTDAGEWGGSGRRVRDERGARTARPIAAPKRARPRGSERALDRQQRSRGLRQGGSAKRAEKGTVGSRAIAGVFGSVRELAPLVTFDQRRKGRASCAAQRTPSQARSGLMFRFGSSWQQPYLDRVSTDLRTGFTIPTQHTPHSRSAGRAQRASLGRATQVFWFHSVAARCIYRTLSHDRR